MRRRAALRALAAFAAAPLVPRSAVAVGTGSLLDIGLVRYGAPGWNARPSSIDRLLVELEVTTSIAVVSSPSTVTLDADSLFACPMVFFCGDREFDPLSDAERDALGLFVRAGGMVVFDSQEGRLDGGFHASVQRELAAILPDAALARIPSDHVIGRSFYLVDGAAGLVAVADWLEGVELDERMAVVFCHNDLLGALARDSFGNWLHEVSPGGDRQRNMAQRLGVNLVMYALCLDYKDDQVHVPFLLERRRWRVSP